MRRAGGLAGRGTCLVGLDAIVVAIVGRPLLRPPLHGIGKFLARILRNLARRLAAKLLAQFDGARGAHLHATAARHALVGLCMGNIGRTRQVGRIKQLRRTQGIAHVYVAVADSEDFVLAIDVGDLVHKAVILGSAQNVVNLFARDVVAAIGLDYIIGHVAHSDAPVVRVVAATLAQNLTACTAAAGRGRVLAVILVQPMLDMLDRHRRARSIDGLLDRNNVHANARASGRHHGRRLRQRAFGRLLEKLREHRMLIQLAHTHVKELGRAGHEHGQHPLLGARGVFPVVLKQAGVAHIVEHLFDLGLGHTRELDHLGQGVGPAHLHLEQNISLLVGGSLGK